MKKLLKIFAVMFIVSVALLAVAAYVPNGDVADAVTADCTHEYSEVVLAQQPSCTQEGWLEHYTCTLCGKYFVKVGEDMVEVDWEDISSPVLVHKWSDWFVKPATCTEDGGEMRYCALCGETEHRGETIDATGHNLTHHEAVASTCEVAGNSEYWSCDRCGLYFSDGQGSQPIEENSWILPLAEHTYGELIEEVSATCTAVGTKAHYECSVCHKLFVDGESGKVEVSAEELVIPTTGHNLTHHEAVESTCEVAGNSEYWSCDRCGLYFSDGQGSQPIEENSWILPLAEHTEETIHGKAATCTETGLTDGVKCSVCNEVLVSQQEIPATGHTYDAVTTRNNVCTVCEHEITQAEIVEKLYALESGEALDGTYLLTGIVTNVDDTNATIIVEEKEIYLYSFQSTDAFLVGDSVSVVGTLKHFDNYYEFDKGTVKGVTHPEYTLTFGANVEGYKVTLADESPVPASATNGTTYEVKITVPSGYKVASVTVNEAVVDMSESGTCSVTVCGETTVHVEIVSKMFSGMVLEATADSLKLNGDSYADNNKDHTVENYIVTTNQIMLRDNVMQWQKNNGSLTVEGTFDKVVVNYSSENGLFTLKVNGVEVEADKSVSGVLTFDLGTSQTGTFVIKVGSEMGKTTSIQFFATICEHEWLAWAHKSDATCTESATESRICDLCGAEEVRTVGEPLGHTWGDWTSNGNGTHTGTCSLCGQEITEDCTFVYEVCEVCGGNQPVHNINQSVQDAVITTPNGENLPVTALHGTELAFTVTPAEGFVVTEVKVNGETVEAVEGVYTITVKATVNIEIVTEKLSDAGEPVIISKTVSELASENGWTNSSKIGNPVELDAVITLSYTGGGNTGKYYSSDQTVRIYQNENPTVTIAAIEGYIVKEVTINYSISNNGVLLFNNEEIESGTVITVNGSSITFNVGNTSTKTNGQVKIQSISVEYQKTN